MKTAILCFSRHHGNTRKLLDAIAAAHDVTLFDVTRTSAPDLSGFDRIGFASGIYYGSFAKQLLTAAETCLPEGREVFFLCTCGAPMKHAFRDIRRIAAAKGCRELGAYQCLGFDTFGPFRLVGGIAKGHPTQEEIRGAVAFYEGL